MPIRRSAYLAPVMPPSNRTSFVRPAAQKPPQTITVSRPNLKEGLRHSGSQRSLLERHMRACLSTPCSYELSFFKRTLDHSSFHPCRARAHLSRLIWLARPTSGLTIGLNEEAPSARMTRRTVETKTGLFTP